MFEKILILGGTKEASELAEKLVTDGHDVTTSLAGRTKEPAPIVGKVRSGGFSSEHQNGAEGLADYLKEDRFTKLIDATHPFAKQISMNAIKAAKLTSMPLEIIKRQPWIKKTGDNWLEVASLEAAHDAIPAGARVFLAIGSQHINHFASRDDIFYLVRMVDEPDALPLPNHQLVIGRPGRTACEEKALIEQHAITHIVCRNSGGTGAYAKIEAARALKIPVIMIGQY